MGRANHFLNSVLSVILECWGRRRRLVVQGGVFWCFPICSDGRKGFFLKLILSVYDYLRKLFKFLCFFFGGGAYGIYCWNLYFAVYHKCISA